ncbi:MAG: hypothetical protein JNM76_04525 [Betaproteobacteria bacterium]|nr:hypothetical protein [Betaproteobacteria bacterium]
MALVILPIDLKPAVRAPSRVARKKSTTAMRERRQRQRAALRLKEML